MGEADDGPRRAAGRATETSNWSKCVQQVKERPTGQRATETSNWSKSVHLVNGRPRHPTGQRAAETSNWSKSDRGVQLVKGLGGPSRCALACTHRHPLTRADPRQKSLPPNSVASRVPYLSSVASRVPYLSSRTRGPSKVPADAKEPPPADGLSQLDCLKVPADAKEPPLRSGEAPAGAPLCGPWRE